MTAVALLAIVVLVLVNGFFVAAEFALVSARPERMTGPETGVRRLGQHHGAQGGGGQRGVNEMMTLAHEESLRLVGKTRAPPLRFGSPGSSGQVTSRCPSLGSRSLGPVDDRGRRE